MPTKSRSMVGIILASYFRFHVLNAIYVNSFACSFSIRYFELCETLFSRHLTCVSLPLEPRHHILHFSHTTTASHVCQHSLLFAPNQQSVNPSLPPLCPTPFCPPPHSEAESAAIRCVSDSLAPVSAGPSKRYRVTPRRDRRYVGESARF